MLWQFLPSTSVIWVEHFNFGLWVRAIKDPFAFGTLTLEVLMIGLVGNISFDRFSFTRRRCQMACFCPIIDCRMAFMFKWPFCLCLCRIFWCRMTTFISVFKIRILVIYLCRMAIIVLIITHTFNDLSYHMFIITWCSITFEIFSNFDLIYFSPCCFDNKWGEEEEKEEVFGRAIYTTTMRNKQC